MFPYVIRHDLIIHASREKGKPRLLLVYPHEASFPRLYLVFCTFTVFFIVSINKHSLQTATHLQRLLEGIGAISCCAQMCCESWKSREKTLFIALICVFLALFSG